MTFTHRIEAAATVARAIYDDAEQGALTTTIAQLDARINAYCDTEGHKPTETDIFVIRRMILESPFTLIMND